MFLLLAKGGEIESPMNWKKGIPIIEDMGEKIQLSQKYPPNSHRTGTVIQLLYSHLKDEVFLELGRRYES